MRIRWGDGEEEEDERRGQREQGRGVKEGRADFREEEGMARRGWILARMSVDVGEEDERNGGGDEEDGRRRTKGGAVEEDDDEKRGRRWRGGGGRNGVSVMR